MRPATYDVEVVNHEIENDVDIQGSGSENTEPVDLEEQRLMEDGVDSSYRGIEAFEMAHLKNTFMAICQGDEIVGLFERDGKGFFYQDIDAGGQEFRCYREVVGGWDRYRGCVGGLD